MSARHSRENVGIGETPLPLCLIETRYFIGLVTFGFIVTWIAIGTVAAFLALLGTFVAVTAVPALLDSRRRQHRANRGRGHDRARPRTVTARPLVDEGGRRAPAGAGRTVADHRRLRLTAGLRTR